VTFHAGKRDLYKHSKTAKHLKAVKAMTSSSFSSIKKAFEKKSERDILEEYVKKIEIQLAAHHAEHNKAYLTAEYLTKVLKKGAKDSIIVQDIKLGPRKRNAIVQNIIAKVETKELVDTLRTTCICNR